MRQHFKKSTFAEITKMKQWCKEFSTGWGLDRVIGFGIME